MPTEIPVQPALYWTAGDGFAVLCAADRGQGLAAGGLSDGVEASIGPINTAGWNADALSELKPLHDENPRCTTWLISRPRPFERFRFFRICLSRLSRWGSWRTISGGCGTRMPLTCF